MKLPEGAIEGIVEEAIEFRRLLHRHPELGYEEHGTVERVLSFLGDLSGARVRKGIGGTGLEVLIGGDLAGPCVGLRADMDALPIDEKSGVDWSSEVSGKMHACGHDGHTAMLAAAGRVLLENADCLTGPVKLIFQPAEEGGGGGLAMCEGGVLESPPVAAVFGLHNNLPGPELTVGKVAYTLGPAMAGTGIFTIDIIGQGGHAAFPHRCIDPIYVSSVLVSQLQSLVSRRLNPLTPAVVSVTAIEGGTTHNVIPESVRLRGTFRALDAAVLIELQRLIEGLSHEVSQAHGARAEVTIEIGYPVLENSPTAFTAFRDVLSLMGEEERLVAVPPNMGGEDFAYYAERVPSFFYYLPACPVGETSYPACHDARFDFNDDLIGLGIRLHVGVAIGFSRVWAR
jgi:amidohydrolase